MAATTNVLRCNLEVGGARAATERSSAGSGSPELRCSLDVLQWSARRQGVLGAGAATKH